MRKNTKRILLRHIFCVGPILLIFTGTALRLFASEVIFNTDLMEAKDRQNINLSSFSRPGYIPPGVYLMTVTVNRQQLSEQNIAFYPYGGDDSDSRPCLTDKDIVGFAIKPERIGKLTWWHQGQCLDVASIAGMEVQGDLAQSTLTVDIPESWLEYQSADWDPPSRWDEGVAGVLLDYTLAMQTIGQQQNASRQYDVSGNGVVGANLEAWRLRADWQSRFASGNASRESQQALDWSRYYAWRALPNLRARLTIGEDYLHSAIFDGFRFAGLSLNTDDSMLPPGLRGYAPEISGVARTNARVIVSQQQRVLYQSQVPAGPFRIQEINDAIAGQLDVRIEEQDGSVQNFQVETATVPFLTRPGKVQYKLAAGRPAASSHHTEGPTFASGEFSWGIANGWSAYGGSLIGAEYQAWSAGFGRDLGVPGALSFDATLSQADLPQQAELSGESLRLSYTKRFEESASQITFAGYRFSDRDFTTMAEYLAAMGRGYLMYNSKQLWTMTFNQLFPGWGLAANLNYSHQTYWNRPASSRYDITLARYFDVGNWKNINVTLAAYRNTSIESRDNGAWLSLVVPWEKQSTLSYNVAVNNRQHEQKLGYFKTLDEANSYQLNSGISDSNALVSGFYHHDGNRAQFNANASYQRGRYSSAGVSAQGGITLTPQGAALHRVSVPGATRLLVDSNGVAGVPVKGYDSPVTTNSNGKAVLTGMNNYYRNSARIDVARLADDVETTRSVVQATLTEGAIGYRQFHVIAGQKAVANIRLANGHYPPFGALLRNQRQQQTGMVNEEGKVYLSGIRAGETMSVAWGEGVKCYVQLPSQLPQQLLSELSLLCQPQLSSEPQRS